MMSSCVHHRVSISNVCTMCWSFTVNLKSPARQAGGKHNNLLIPAWRDESNWNRSDKKIGRTSHFQLDIHRGERWLEGDCRNNIEWSWMVSHHEGDRTMVILHHRNHIHQRNNQANERSLVQYAQSLWANPTVHKCLPSPCPNQHQSIALPAICQ